MYCPKCGTENDDNTYRCVDCSEIIQVISARSAVRPIEEDPAMRMLLPVGRSLLAIAAGYAGLFAVLFVPAPIALILGILAVVDIKKHPDKLGMGRAVFAIIMGVIFSIPLMFWLVLMVIGMLSVV